MVQVFREVLTVNVISLISLLFHWRFIGVSLLFHFTNVNYEKERALCPSNSKSGIPHCVGNSQSVHSAKCVFDC